MPQTHPTARSHASQNRLLALFTTTLCLLALMAATAFADASSGADPQADASGSLGVCAAVESTVVTRNESTVSLDLLVFTPGIRGSTVAAFLGPRLRERMCMPDGSTLVFGNSTRNNHTSASYVFLTVSAQCPHGSPDCAVKPFNYLFNEFTDNARFVYDLYIDEVLIYNNTGTQASTCAQVDDTPIYVVGPRLMLVLNFTGRWEEAAAAICMPLGDLDVTFVQPNHAEVRAACPNSNRSCAVKPFNALYGKRHDVASFGITAVLLVDLSSGSDSDSLDSEAASSNAAPDCSAVAATPVFVWGPQLTLTLDAVSASSFDSDALRRLAAFACTQLHSFLVLYGAPGRVSLVSNCGDSNINCAVLPFNFIRNSRHELHRFGIENARLSNTDGDGSAPDASGEWASSDAGSLSPDRCAEVARTTVHVHGSKLTLTLAMTSTLTPSDAAQMRHALGALMCLDPGRFRVSLVGPRSVTVTPACPPTGADCASLPFNFAYAHGSTFAHLGVSHVHLSAVDDSSAGSSTHDLPRSHDSSSSSDAASAAPSICQMVRGTTSLFASRAQVYMYAVATFETQQALSYSQWRFLLSRELCVPASMFDIRLVSTRKVYVTDTSGSADEDNTNNAKEDLGLPQRGANAAKAAPFGLPRGATSRRVQGISAAGKHGARDTNHVEREATNRRPELARHPLGVPQSGAPDKETPRQGTSADIPAMSPQERADFEASFMEIAAAGKKAVGQSGRSPAAQSLAEQDVDAGIERAVHEMYYHHSFTGTVHEVVVRQYALLNRCPTYNTTCLDKPLSFLHKEISTNPSALPEIDWASVGLNQGDENVGQCASIRAVVLPSEPIADPVLRLTRWGWPSVQWKKDVGEALCLSPNEYTATIFHHPRPSAKHEVTDEMKDAENGGPATEARGMYTQAFAPGYSFDFRPKCSGGQCVVKAFLYASEYFAKHGRFPGPATLSVATVEFLYHGPATSGPDSSDSGGTSVCTQVRNHPTTVAGSRVYLRIRTTVSFADSQMAEWRLTFAQAVCASPSELAITNELQTGTIRVHQHCFTQAACHEVLRSLNFAAARYWTLPPVLKIADAALFGGGTGNNGAAGGGDGGDDKFPKAAVIAVAVIALIAVVAVVAAAAFTTFYKYVLYYRRRRAANVAADDVEGDTDVEMAQGALGGPRGVR